LLRGGGNPKREKMRGKKKGMKRRGKGGKHALDRLTGGRKRDGGERKHLWSSTSEEKGCEEKNGERSCMVGRGIQRKTGCDYLVPARKKEG